MRALPATAEQPAMAVCAPMWTLWPIWIWLSRRTSSSSTVSSSAPRSMVVLAPISQSSPTATPPSCGTLIQRPAETVGAEHCAGVHEHAPAQPHAADERDVRAQFAALADDAVLADRAAG